MWPVYTYTVKIIFLFISDTVMNHIKRGRYVVISDLFFVLMIFLCPTED